jgi:hypothetical protein
MYRSPRQGSSMPEPHLGLLQVSALRFGRAGRAQLMSRTNSRFACVPAALYCWSLFSELQNLVRLLLSVRRSD